MKDELAPKGSKGSFVIKYNSLSKRQQDIFLDFAPALVEQDLAPSVKEAQEGLQLWAFDIISGYYLGATIADTANLITLLRDKLGIVGEYSTYTSVGAAYDAFRQKQREEGEVN
jgi:hypothetical protein